MPPRRVRGRRFREEPVVAPVAVEVSGVQHVGPAMDVNPPAGGNVRVAEVRGEHQSKVLDRFLKKEPPKFSGATSPIQALEFIQEVEKVFDAMGIDDEMKVKFTVYRLHGGAYSWWTNTHRSLVAAGRVPVLWAAFVDLFKAKYCLTSHMLAMEEELMELKQGDLTVGGYEERFSELCRLFPEVHVDEQRRMARFRAGLNHEIRARISLMRFESMHELNNAAQQVERDLGEGLQAGKKRGRWESPSVGGPSGMGFSERPSQQSRFSQSQFSASAVRPQFSTAGTRSRSYSQVGGSQGTSQSRPISGDCYRCGQAGHQAAECRRQQRTVCLRCNQLGHVVSGCPQARGSRSEVNVFASEPSVRVGFQNSRGGQSHQGRGAGGGHSGAGTSRGQMFAAIQEEPEHAPYW